MKQKAIMEDSSAVLGSIDIFSRLQKADLQALSAKMEQRSFKAGQSMFREGESGEELFVVASGLISVSVRSHDAEDIELSRVGRGAFFGEMAILERASRSATCTALEATECLVLKAGDFEALLIERPGAGVNVLESMLGIAAGRLLKTGSFLSQMVQWGDDARKRAVTDAATGLFNRRYLEDSFEGMVSRAKHDHAQLSYAMFDLDRFGKLNATYGTAFCDRIILEIADTFRKVFAEDDILVRYGGDEFCFIIPGPESEARQKCGNVCASLRELVFPEHPELRISCSIGIAHYPGVASTTEELKEKADKALYMAKEAGRDRAISWQRVELDAPKRDITSIAKKNRVVANIRQALEERDSFLIIGHKDPDEDCVSSMVAFALLANKFNKKSAIFLGPTVQDHFAYLLNICRYNEIEIVQEGRLPACSALVLVDTPKPEMIEQRERFEALCSDVSVLKIELDHHLGADSRYYGDAEYRLVYEASSTCETIGFLALKLENDNALMSKYQIAELLSRNLVLAILSGMIGDSQMGRYLKTRRESWFYRRFSALFEKMLESKTRSGSGNFSNKEQVFEAMAALSDDEDACFRYMSKNTTTVGRVRYAVLDPESSRHLFATFGNDTAITVSKALVDSFAESSGFLGLIGYYDDPVASPFVQFRLRRSQHFNTLDLREALSRLQMTNGGGHPGAVGFRIERSALTDIEAAAKAFATTLESLIAESLASAPEKAGAEKNGN